MNAYDTTDPAAGGPWCPVERPMPESGPSDEERNEDWIKHVHAARGGSCVSWGEILADPLLAECAIERWNGLTGSWAVVVGKRLAGRAVEALLGPGREVTEIGLGTFLVEIDGAELDELNRGQLVRRNAWYRLTAVMP